MTEVGQDVRRVSLHADGHTVDLTLPAAVPIVELLPSVLDLFKRRYGSGAVPVVPFCYQVSCPGAPALDSSKTLADNHIINGTLLMLTRSSTEFPAPTFDDAAEAVSATLTDATRPWTRQHSRLISAVAAAWMAGLGTALIVRSPLCPSVGVTATTGCVALSAAVLAQRVYREPVAGVTLGLIATGLAAVAGFLAVPDGPGPANALLAAMTAGVVAVLTVRLTGCGTQTFTAVSCVALIMAVAAAASVVIALTLPAMGLLSTVVSLALLEVSARLSITWSGLPSRSLDGPDVMGLPDRLRDNVVRANRLLNSLVAGSAAAAAAGAIITVASASPPGGARPAAASFAADTGAVLLLRARSHLDFTKTLTLLVAGTATLSAAFLAAGAATQRPVSMVAVIIVPVAVAMCLGFVVPALSFSPVGRRGVELLEYLGLIAIVPLACWTCGLYGVGLRMKRIVRVAAAVALTGLSQCSTFPVQAVTPPPIDDKWLPEPAVPVPSQPTVQREVCAVPFTDPDIGQAETFPQLVGLSLSRVWQLSAWCRPTRCGHRHRRLAAPAAARCGPGRRLRVPRRRCPGLRRARDCCRRNHRRPSRIRR